MAADLVRSIHPVPHDLEMDFLRISSYVGTQSSGNGTMAMQSRLPVKDRHVLVVSLLSQEHINSLAAQGAVLLCYIPKVLCCGHCTTHLGCCVVVSNCQEAHHQCPRQMHAYATSCEVYDTLIQQLMVFVALLIWTSHQLCVLTFVVFNTESDYSGGRHC